jgi:hypothetical protein
MTAMIAFALTGCATGNRLHPLRDGWQTGWVVNLQAAKDMRAAEFNNQACLAEAGIPTTATIAAVDVPYLRSMRHLGVVITNGAQVKVGDKVLVNTNDCRQPLSLVRS